MNLGDKLKQAAKQAQEAAAEHKDQMEQAIGKAGDFADQRTGGKYREKIEKAQQKAGAYVDKLQPESGPAAGAAGAPEGAGGAGAAEGAEAAVPKPAAPRPGEDPGPPA